MTISLQTYLNNLQNLSTWFTVFGQGGGEAMIAETRAFIVDATYEELTRQTYFPINRMVEEAVLVNRCRQYAVTTCRELLELGFLIDNLYDIIERKRRKEISDLWDEWDDWDECDHMQDTADTLKALDHLDALGASESHSGTELDDE